MGWRGIMSRSIRGGASFDCVTVHDDFFIGGVP